MIRSIFSFFDLVFFFLDLCSIGMERALGVTLRLLLHSQGGCYRRLKTLFIDRGEHDAGRHRLVTVCRDRIKSRDIMCWICHIGTVS